MSLSGLVHAGLLSCEVTRRQPDFTPRSSLLQAVHPRGNHWL